MRRVAWVALILLVLPAAATAQDRRPAPTERPRMEAQQQRRSQLEEQVRRQFVAQAAQVLGLNATQRTRLDEVIRSGAEERHELARESRALRMELVRAVRSDALPATGYERLLTRMSDLRQREQRLERSEEAALAGFLDPRQRAQLLVLRMQLNERVRGMRGSGQGEGRADRPRGSGS